jgi:hypothetical protein
MTGPVSSTKPAVGVTEGCDLLSHWSCHGTGDAGTWYLVPSADGGRLFRRHGLQGFLESLAPWGLSAGVDLAAARVVSRLPAPTEVPHWPPLRPQFPAPETKGRSIRLDFGVPFELYLFRGHFPAVPIVPGAVLTGWVTELAREHCGWQHGATNVAMLKFRRIVQPGLTYDLQIDVSAEGSTLDFHIRLQGKTCALGALMARPHDDR